MEIHELNTFSGTPGANDYLATDNGNDTSKIAIKSITDPLNERIDNIIAGPASSAQEVIDARLGADGVTYPSLGNAIRTQFTDIKSDLNDEAALRVNGEIDIDIAWSQGGISGSGTNVDSYTTRIRTNDYYDFRGRSLVVSSATYLPRYQFIVYKYTTDKVFVPDATAYSAANFPTVVPFEQGYLYRLSWLDTSGQTTATSDQIGIKYASQIEYVPDIVADYVADEISSYSIPIVTDKDYCFECVHHDNFSRAESGWTFGQNAGATYDVNNYEDVVASSVDTGFRVDNGLTCPRDTSRANSFSVELLKATHNENFMVEFTAPVYPNYNCLAWDVQDVNNFVTLQIGKESSYTRILCVNIVRGSYGSQIYSKNVYNVNPEIVQVYFINGVCSIYFDDQIVGTFAIKPFTSKIGIASYKGYNLVMSFINMFNLASHVTFNPNYILDRGIETVPTTTLSANTGRYSLSSDPARWSNYAEHFTLESTDPMIYHGIRTERATESLVDSNLRTVHYEFDVMFPTGYGFDTATASYHDSIFQFHDRESDLTTRGDVCFYLAVIGDKLTVYMSSTTEALSTNVITQANFEPILTIEEGKWYHVEIDQRERYEENQHPFTRIKVDGEILWESRKPNCYNDRRGSGLQYGIYKNNWGTITSMGRYFDNVKVVF